MYSMHGHPLLLWMAMSIAIGGIAAFGRNWRPTRYWMAALILAAIPMTERLMYAAATMARFNTEWSFDIGGQLLLWTGFWAIPIALVFYLTRTHFVRVDPVLAAFAGVATYLMCAAIAFMVFFATDVIRLEDIQ